MSIIRKKNETQDTVLDATSPKIDVHSNIRLFPHQQALVAKMIAMESAPRTDTLFGVLKDPPGTGKSYPLLALMLYEKRQFKRTQNLLVIPHNIHQQWLKYIKDFSSELEVMSLMYYGDITALFHDARALFEYDILITTSTFYDMVTSTVRDINAYFNRVILDEIDSISFFTMSQIPAQSVWLVSASAELTKTGAYAQNVKKNGIMCDPLFIRRSINLPPPKVEHHTCYNEYVSILSQGVLGKDDLNSVYALNFAHFRFAYLRNEDTVTNSQQLLSAMFRDSALALFSNIDSIKSLERGAKYQTYLPPVLAKKFDEKGRLENTLNNIVSLIAGKKCPLCADSYDTLLRRVTTKCCSTMFHLDCLKTWLLKTCPGQCPTCCSDCSEQDGFTDSTQDIVSSPVACGLNDKMEEFKMILENEVSRPDFRILIFSDMTGTFLKVCPILKEREIQYAEIEGNQYTMDRAMADYKSGKKPVLLVDAQSYGAGMNMEMTSAVIIMHKTEREPQVIGRAQRLGRKDELHVHHLLYSCE